MASADPRAPGPTPYAQRMTQIEPRVPHPPYFDPPTPRNQA
jgi:hypothetical protein